MHIELPQLVYLFLVFVSIGMACAKHGEPKTGTDNGWITTIASAIVLSILWWGGFFS